MSWLFGDKDSVEAHKQAKEDLHNWKTKSEDDEYLRRNRRVIETEKDVPWWRR